MPWCPPLLCVWCAINFFPAREDQTTSSMASQQFTHVPLGSLPIKMRYGPLRQSVQECLVFKGSCSHQLEVRALNGVSDVFVIENGHHRKVLCLPKFEEVVSARQSSEQVRVLEESHFCSQCLCVWVNTAPLPCKRDNVFPRKDGLMSPMSTERNQNGATI